MADDRSDRTAGEYGANRAVYHTRNVFRLPSRAAADSIDTTARNDATGIHLSQQHAGAMGGFVNPDHHRQGATSAATLGNWPAAVVISDTGLESAQTAIATSSVIRNQHMEYHLHHAPQLRSHVDLDYQFHPPAIFEENYNDMAATGFGVPHQMSPYMQAGLYDVPLSEQPAPNFPPSRNTQMDPMGVLSAESYNDGIPRRSSAQRSTHPSTHPARQYQEVGRDVGSGPIFGISSDVEPRRKGKQGKPAPAQSDESEPMERRRKKQKLSVEDDEDEASKKSRGRPRLDTKDETAADRRRTQIRMAQRAYRNRKETTIQSLEKQVQELRGTNEEMSNIFMNLYDFAVGKGLVQREPEFAQHLRSTTERFLALAGSVAAEDIKDEDGHNSEQQDAPVHENQSRSRQESGSEPQERITSVWGYQVNKEDTPDEEAGQNNFTQQPLGAVSRPGEHQIISRATEENASFINFDFFDNLQQYRAEIPDATFDYSYFLSADSTLPLPSSYSASENTFARRLQRSTSESGWRLINSKNINRVNDVFGFCLRFETKDQIKQRIWGILTKDSKGALYDWKEPFLHLGGSGTFYPSDQSISGDLQPKMLSGMSMGPFSSPVIDTRDKDMLNEYRIKVPGFEGEFFDSNDVEGYLRGRGIFVGPDSEFVDVDLDQLEFHEHVSSTNGSLSVDSSPMTPLPIVTDVTATWDASAENEDPFSAIPERTDCAVPYSMNFPEWSAGSQDLVKTTDNVFDLTGPIFNAMPMAEQTMKEETGEKRKRGNKRIVTLSVSALVSELVGKAVCLGRAPGFRPADVDLAVRRAIIGSSF